MQLVCGTSPLLATLECYTSNTSNPPSYPVLTEKKNTPLQHAIHVLPILRGIPMEHCFSGAEGGLRWRKQKIRKLSELLYNDRRTF